MAAILPRRPGIDDPRARFVVDAGAVRVAIDDEIDLVRDERGAKAVVAIAGPAVHVAVSDADADATEINDAARGKRDRQLVRIDIAVDGVHGRDDLKLGENIGRSDITGVQYGLCSEEQLKRAGGKSAVGVADDADQALTR